MTDATASTLWGGAAVVMTAFVVQAYSSARASWRAGHPLIAGAFTLAGAAFLLAAVLSVWFAALPYL